MSTPESAVVNAALHYLQWKGVFAWRNNSGAKVEEATAAHARRFIQYGYRGSADILGVTLSGKFLACECKAGRGKLSSYQEAFLAEVTRRGGVAIVVRETDWQQVIDEALGVMECQGIGRTDADI